MKYISLRNNGFGFPYGDVFDGDAIPDKKLKQYIRRKWVLPVPSDSDNTKQLLHLASPVSVSDENDANTGTPKQSTVVTNFNTGGPVNRPTCAIEVGDELWINGYYSGVARFDVDFSYLGKLPIPVGHPTNTPDAARYITAMAYNDDDIIVVCMQSFHVVKAYNTKTGDILWTAGISGSPGDFSFNKFNNPRDVVFLPNGNILVSSYYGVAQAGSLSKGYVVELSITDGSLVNIIVDCETSGEPWHSQCSYPTNMHIDAGLLYLSLHNSNAIGVWDTNDWRYVTSYTKDAVFNVNQIHPGSISISSGSTSSNQQGKQDDTSPTTNKHLAVFLNGPKVIALVDIDTHNIADVIGIQLWDDKRSPRNKPTEFQDVRNIVHLSDGHILVCDYGNNRISKIHPDNYNVCTYQLPNKLTDGQVKTIYPSEIVSSGVFDFDENTYTIRIPVGDTPPEVVMILD